MPERIRFLDAFDDRELDVLLRYCSMSRVREGEAIIRQGDVADHQVYLIVVGRVAVEAEAESPGASRTLCVLEDGQVFGEYSLFSSEARSATVRALTYTEVLHIDLDRIDRMFEAEPRLAFKLVKHIAREASRKLSGLGR